MSDETEFAESSKANQAGWVRVLGADGVRASLALIGEFDGRCVDEVTAAFSAQFAAGRRLLRADLRSVTFMNTAVLGRLVDAHRRAMARHGTLILTGVRPPTERLMRITGTDSELLYCTAEHVREPNEAFAEANSR